MNRQTVIVPIASGARGVPVNALAIAHEQAWRMERRLGAYLGVATLTGPNGDNITVWQWDTLPRLANGETE